MSKPHVITINGVTLTDGQSLAVEIALRSFWHDLSYPDALGQDAQGRKLAVLHRARLGEILELIN